MRSIRILALMRVFFFFFLRMGYTFFKPLDLSRSNGKKKTIINANILIDLI